MITITFNNDIIAVSNDQTLTDVLSQKGYTEGCYAVSKNRCFIPKSEWATVRLSDNDLIEIITPMQGG